MNNAKSQKKWRIEHPEAAKIIQKRYVNSHRNQINATIRKRRAKLYANKPWTTMFSRTQPARNSIVGFSVC